MVDPDPTEVPPQLPEYHCQLAPVPKEPPFTVKFVVEPTHIGFGVAVALVGATEGLLTVTAKHLGALVPQRLFAVTQIFPVLPGVAVIEVVP